MSFLKRILGTKNDRRLKAYYKDLESISALEPKFSSMSDSELANHKERHLKEAREKGPSKTLLHDSYAYIREVSKRTLGMRHFDVQIIGGLVLNDGMVAEMRTGEGKTLVSTLPAYYNSLFGSVHIVTANDYLAKRDCEIIKPIYDFLDFRVDSISSDSTQAERQEAYKSHVVYITSAELGFDYLRDHIAMDPMGCVQRRDLDYVIVDELDSVLLDEARTPLVISGQSEAKPEDYVVALDLASTFVTIDRKEYDKDKTVGTYHAIVDHQKRNVEITENGFEEAEQYFLKNNFVSKASGMYSSEGLKWMQVLRVMLSAMNFYRVNVDYIVSDKGEVQIIDEGTGRIMKGRRWNDGIHQCIETIEGVQVHPESINYASISIQNFFKLYKKLSGMTGTADTEATELNYTYGLDVVVIPTNKPVIRKDEGDRLFSSIDSKMKFLIRDVIKSNERGQPVLIGTENVHMSEYISEELKRHDIHHEILNAKNNGREAFIIAQAGRPGAITISTNMAGRGTDIILGGNPEYMISQLDNPDDETKKAIFEKCKEDQKRVIDAGGLRVIGTGRHQTRRIDNQLIGRAGRQGDPGSSIFYLSLDDDLLSKFIHPTQRKMIESIGLRDTDYISDKMIDSVVRKAQQMIENMHYEVRRNMLQFDNVINEQRSVIYAIRDDVMHTTDFINIIYELIDDLTESLIAEYIDSTATPDYWKIEELENDIQSRFGIALDISQTKDFKNLDYYEFTDRLNKSFRSIAHHFLGIFGEEFMTTIARQILLTSIDQNWRDHVDLMSDLLDGIHLRGYAQKDPRQEYKREAFELFKSMESNITNQFLTLFYLNVNQMIYDEMQRESQPDVQINEYGSFV